MTKAINVTVEKCIGCKSCALVCSLFKSGSLRPNSGGVVVQINQLNKEEKPVICRQCKHPKCVGACPSGSLTVDSSGVVLVSNDKCTGCWACLQACPFNAIHKDTVRNIAVKCDLCYGYDHGPRCVSICPVQTLTYPK